MGDIIPITIKTFDQKETEHVFSLLKLMFMSVDNQDFTPIFPYVSERKGIFIDLKSWKSKEDFIKEITDKNSFLFSYYCNTQNLRKITNDENQTSLLDLLKKTHQIKADFYLISETEMELKIHLLDMPHESYRFNNPYFIKEIKEQNHWYIYRLF
ncbi:MAG: hypothetical protein NZ853_03310 [Leptospiraceae bacterium]|nr:hypothetical protein [Leptospiraceae bacterium]MDW7975202.1 hypothetical protein [Leptospiraceae bacterium]